MRGQRGVTLIELVLLIAIGAVTIGGLVLFVRQMVLAEIDSRDRVIAMNLARLKMAETNNLSFSSLTAGVTPLADEALFPGFDMRRRVTTLDTDPGPVTLLQVDIQVDAEGGTFASPLAQLTAYRQSHVEFGGGS